MKIILIILCFVFVSIPGTAIASTNTVTVIVLGDSLSASYGMPSEAGWVNLMEQRLQAHSPIYQVINISVSGETTLGGRNRIEQALIAHQPDIVIIGLGANDGLLGSSIKSIYDNLQAIIKACQQNNASTLLLGMRIPPNYGASYTQKFHDLYSQLAENYQLKLVPFLLAGFGEKREFFLSDGMHPNILAQELIVKNVWEVLYTMLNHKSTALIIDIKENNLHGK